MPVILNVSNLRKHFGPEPVLSDVSFQVRSGDKIGLVGPNGCGKTTLLNILVGLEENERGAIEKSPDISIGYLEQRPEFTEDRTVLEEARRALGPLFSIQKESEEIAVKIGAVDDPAEHERLAKRFDRIHEELMQKDGYNLEYRIEKILHGVGFLDEELSKNVSMLSGGELNRLSLARLLLQEPDIMLLDEPSNHLDLAATEWLEEFLANTKAAVILVSHDRYFLDRVTNRTFELFMGTIDVFPGNFSKYTMLKEERLAVQTKTYEKYVEEVEKAKDFIRRHHYGMKAAQAEDRRKKLERLEEEPADLPRKITTPGMKFPPASRTGDIVFRIEDLSKGFDGRLLFKDLTLNFERGQRWAILGPNGCGKTTLLKCLLGELDPDSGSVQAGQGVKVGYFDQHLHVLDDNTPVVDAIRPQGKIFEDLQRRSLLGAFGLTGDQQLQTVGNLSGGQRCRAALAMLAANDPNVMILDEPTNHLDLWARAALEKSVREFDGTVLFISHDRYFVDKVADHLLIIQPDAHFRVIEGNYTWFRHMVSKGLIKDPFLPHALEEVEKKPDPPAPRPPVVPFNQKNANKKKKNKVKSNTPPQGSAVQKPIEKIKPPVPPSGGKKIPLPPSSVPQTQGPPVDLDAKKKEKSKEKRKRKYPFRKVEDIEAEVFMVETQLITLREEVIKPEVLRDGEKVRALNEEIADAEQQLKQLYEHWDEATELNW
ncbi:MAG: ABC-F family ATP-binding cassette domain-containing protein [Planctomycetia bacterium]|nr:ABC-F family ATP-binding cassette domain-containing protein [Planctomycetia bacterium]